MCLCVWVKYSQWCKKCTCSYLVYEFTAILSCAILICNAIFELYCFNSFWMRRIFKQYQHCATPILMDAHIHASILNMIWMYVVVFIVSRLLLPLPLTFTLVIAIRKCMCKCWAIYSWNCPSLAIHKQHYFIELIFSTDEIINQLMCVLRYSGLLRKFFRWVFSNRRVSFFGRACVRASSFVRFSIIRTSKKIYVCMFHTLCVANKYWRVKSLFNKVVQFVRSLDSYCDFAGAKFAAFLNNSYTKNVSKVHIIHRFRHLNERISQ